MLYALIALVLGIVALPFLAEALRRPMTRRRQASAPGEIAPLEYGPTHYKLSGPENGQLVICIHGLSTPSYVFAATERSLVDMGYRVLTYDLYGRGYSARVAGLQNRTYFHNQLRALVDHLQLDGPFIVLGFSMGGMIASAFAAEDERVEKLILVASAGLAPVETTGQSNIWRMPVIGDWLTWVFGGIALRRELVEHKSTATVIPNFEDRQAAETRMRGFLPALLSSRRHMLSGTAEADIWVIAGLDMPVLAIWGRDDPVIPLRAMSRLSELHSDAHHVEIREAGHNLLQTHPTEVATALYEFLRGVPRPY